MLLKMMYHHHLYHIQFLDKVHQRLKLGAVDVARLVTIWSDVNTMYHTRLAVNSVSTRLALAVAITEWSTALRCLFVTVIRIRLP